MHKKCNNFSFSFHHFGLRVELLSKIVFRKLRMTRAPSCKFYFNRIVTYFIGYHGLIHRRFSDLKEPLGEWANDMSLPSSYEVQYVNNQYFVFAL